MNTSNAHEAKQAVRKTVRLARKNGFACGEAHAQKLIELVVRNGFRTVAAYEEFDNEPSLESFRSWCQANGVQVLLPKISSETELSWGLGRTLGDAELIIMPALAAGRDGTRLGRGKGYYDRAVAGLDAPRVAVVHDQELFHTVPADSHDQTVSMVVTCSESIKTDGRLN